MQTTMQTFSLLSHYSNLPISVLVSKPSAPPRAVVQIAHGMCEHKERYIPFIRFLTENGFACVIHDHRGHGESVFRKEDLGFMYDGGSNAVIDDAKLVNDWIHQTFPTQKIFLIGHSMGSFVARCYTRRYDESINGLFVIGSPSNVRHRPLGQWIINILKRIQGERHRSELMKRLTFGNYLKGIENPISPNAWLCSDDHVVREHDQDPLCGFTFTLNAYDCLFHLMAETYSKKIWNNNDWQRPPFQACNPLHPDLPIFFLGGKEDPCIGGEKRFNHAIQTMENAGFKNIKARLFDKMRHEILNEHDKESVWELILHHLFNLV